MIVSKTLFMQRLLISDYKRRSYARETSRLPYMRLLLLLL